MKNNTKKVLACLIAGTVAVGVKYKLEQKENKKKKKNNIIKKAQQLQEKMENKNRYIKIENNVNKIPFEEGINLNDIEEDINVLEKNEVKQNIELMQKEETAKQEVIKKQILEQQKEVSVQEFIERQKEKLLAQEVIEEEKKEKLSTQEFIEKQKEEKIVTIAEENEEMELQEVEFVIPTNNFMEQIAVTEEVIDDQTAVIEEENIEIVTPVADCETKDVMIDTNLEEVPKDLDSENYEEENVDLEETKKILKRKINWQESDGVKTKIDYSRLPAAAVLNVSELSLVEIKSLFTIQEISDEIFKRIYGKSYKTDCIVPRTELRYLRMLYYGFDDKTHVGEMIVNVSIAEDIKDIFYLLYQEKYQIERMVLVDEYGADDVLSMAANNTSAFNYRKIDGMSVMSKHSRGIAVDVNPKQNPYVRIINGEINCQPQSGEIYMDRKKDFPHKIDHEDLCYCLFRTYGFIWGGDWEDMKDYQHFQKQF